MRTLSRGVEAAREGTPRNVRFDTPFKTGERVLSVKMNFFQHGENATNTEESISGDDVHYWSEVDNKMAWIREPRIRIFMQMKLKACLDELDWLIRYHNCAAYNDPEEDYPPRPLPIPPDYIDNLQNRLVKAKRAYYYPL